MVLIRKISNPKKKTILFTVIIESSKLKTSMVYKHLIAKSLLNLYLIALLG